MARRSHRAACCRQSRCAKPPAHRDLLLRTRPAILFAVVVSALTACAGSSSEPPVAEAQAEGAETAGDRFEDFAAHREAVNDELLVALNAHTDAVEKGDSAEQHRTASQLRAIAREEVMWLDEHRADEVADECWYRVWSRWFYAMTHTKTAAEYAIEHSASGDAEPLDQFADFIGMAGDFHQDALDHLSDARSRC